MITDIVKKMPTIVRYDIKGNLVTRVPEIYPYSYDKFAIWENGYSLKDCAVYSDRLYQLNADKYNSCCEKIWGNRGQMFYDRDIDDIEKFLSMYYEKSVTLTGIEQGCNVSNGFPFWIFYYREVQSCID